MVEGQTSAMQIGPNILNHKEVGKGPFINVTIEGVAIRALLDTGATTSSINPKIIYDDLKGKDINKRSVRSSIKVADGAMVEANEIALLDITIPGNEPVNHEFIVVNFHDIDMIIGFDFMVAHQALINTAEGTFIFKQKDQRNGGQVTTELLSRRMVIEDQCFQLPTRSDDAQSAHVEILRSCQRDPLDVEDDDIGTSSDQEIREANVSVDTELKVPVGLNLATEDHEQQKTEFMLDYNRTQVCVSASEKMNQLHSECAQESEVLEINCTRKMKTELKEANFNEQAMYDKRESDNFIAESLKTHIHGLNVCQGRFPDKSKVKDEERPSAIPDKRRADDKQLQWMLDKTRKKDTNEDRKRKKMTEEKEKERRGRSPKKRSVISVHKEMSFDYQQQNQIVVI